MTKSIWTVAGAAAGILALIASAPAASAQAAPDIARIVTVPANSSPPVPAGLKVTCLAGPDQLASAPTCPVVTYKGITTWAFSYIDNRVSLALVSYDRDNNVVANVEKPGARYVWQANSSPATDTVTFFGQANQSVTASWSELGGR